MQKRNKKTEQKRNNFMQYTVKEPIELLPFLFEVLTDRSRNAVKSILTRGQVSINDQVITKHDHPLKPGQTVVIMKNKVAKARNFTGLSILHEDADVVVIDKEAGLLSISSPKEKAVTAYRQLSDYVRQTDPKNRVFIVHRLDRDTSGVMMFAKNEYAKQKLQNAWKEMVKERTYAALVEGKVQKREGTISSWLKETSTFKMYSSPKANDGQHAVTHYKVIQSNQDCSLLEVQLETGRKNQIRVHMQDIGHPIIGDKKYGSTRNDINRLGLHAQVIAFHHPTSGKLLRFSSDLPKTFLNKSK
ncbi:RluA family pseudouridine synthase [Radiobacillus sp. PE A8.2]|uniref:RluA family pseudouridine synthase n=1 Tax=Radiobacillus sp. PE A8.2 TaxID=3380349 RepID=UPI003890E77C